MLTADALREGVIEQIRVLHALLLREIRVRFGMQRVGYAWALVEPSIHIGVMYALREVMGGLAPQHIPMLLWLISGVIPFFLFRNTTTRIVGAIRANLDVLILPPVRIMDILIARTLLELGTYCAIFFIALSAYHLVFGLPPLADPLTMLACLCLLAFMGKGYGLIFMVLSTIFPSVQPLIGGIQRILYFSSGVFFSVTRVPYELREYLAWNPLLHIFESLRMAMFYDYHGLEWASSLTYAFFFAVVMWVLAVLLMKRYLRLILDL